MNWQVKNIAFCFSGEPRHWDEGLKTINLFKEQLPHCRIDIFCHLWDSSHIKTGDTTFDIDLYNCTSGGIYPKTDIIPFLKGYKKEHLIEKTINSNKPCYGQFYSMGKCQEFRIEYEKQYNISYDLVFRTRTDIRFNSLPEINKIYKKIKKSNYLITPEIGIRKGAPFMEFALMVSDSIRMNILFDNYLSINYSKPFDNSYGHRRFLDHIIKHDINVRHYPFDYTLVRPYKFPELKDGHDPFTKF